jgi:hypothetical protein
MESPDIWDLLTASLAACDLKKPHKAWAFLVVQGLVSDSGEERNTFVEIVSDVQTRADIIGPSVAFRVAGSLTLAGVTLPAGQVPDPWGECAKQRLETIASWRTDTIGDPSGMET